MEWVIGYENKVGQRGRIIGCVAIIGCVKWLQLCGLAERQVHIL